MKATRTTITTLCPVDGLTPRGRQESHNRSANNGERRPQLRLRRLGAVVACTMVLLAGTACRSLPGAPKASYSSKDQIAALTKDFDEQTTIAAYAEAPFIRTPDAPTAKTKKEIRDAYISKRLTLIDLYYEQWVHSAAFARQAWDTATDIAVLGINAAGTLVGGAEAKAIMHAVAGGITGSKLAVDKNFFYEKTVPALVAAMEAERQKALNPIIIGSQNDKVEGKGSYPLTQAIVDLNTYYFAGTFLGALNGIQTDAVTIARDVAQVNQHDKKSKEDQTNAHVPTSTQIESTRARFLK